MNVRKLRGLRWVRRFNFHQCINYESVAEHSFFVAMIVGYLSDWDMEAVDAALFHDVEESVTGDIPFLIKKELDTEEVERSARNELGIAREKILFPADRILVELADVVETKIYLEEERKAGNQNLFDIEMETIDRMWLLLKEIGDPIITRKVKDMISMVPCRPTPGTFLTHEGEQWKSQ